ncbi:MAG: oxygenase MpaB family protein [Sandaracinus sp.]
MADEVPTDFRFFERARHPAVRATRALIRGLTGVDPAPDDDVARAFAAAYFDGDPVADAYVADAYAGRDAARARGLLSRAITHGIDAVPEASPALVRLIRDAEARPAWLDPARVARGARVFRHYGIDVFRFAGAITASAYRESSVAKPLVLTGAYAGGTARRRFLETASFWIDVSEPGGLDRFAPGFASALQVRVMHSVLRRKLLSHAEWKREAWGVPISQGDATLTLLGGSVAPGIAMHVLGYRTSTEDMRDLLHFWRYVGHVMGVRFTAFPETVGDALRLSFVAALKGSSSAGQDGLTLARGYGLAFAPSEKASLRDRLEHAEHLAMTRLFAASSTYRGARLPPALPLVALPLARAPFLLVSELVRRRVPVLDELRDRRVRSARRAWLERHLHGDAARFRPVDQLAR